MKCSVYTRCTIAILRWPEMNGKYAVEKKQSGTNSEIFTCRRVIIIVNTTGPK